MALINGSSSFAEVLKEYGDTAAPFDSADQCRRFIRAAGILLTMPAESSGPEGGTRYDARHVAKELQDAKNELPSLGGPTPQSQHTRRVTVVSFRNSR